MLDDDKRAQWDQNQSTITEVIPPLLRSFYVKLINEGFSETDAFKLTDTYLTNLTRSQ